jgi:hypothetical protein
MQVITSATQFQHGLYISLFNLDYCFCKSKFYVIKFKLYFKSFIKKANQKLSINNFQLSIIKRAYFCNTNGFINSPRFRSSNWANMPW